MTRSRFEMGNDSEVKRLKAVYRDYGQQSKYRHKWSPANPGNQAMVRERNRLWLALLAERGYVPLSSCRILDLGCGSGQNLAPLLEWGATAANLCGVDLLPDRISEAKESFPEIHFQVGNGASLGFRDNSFDLVLLFTVFSSILEARMAHEVSREVSRVLKPGGAVVWYDLIYHNPGNPHVQGLPRAAIQDLFPHFIFALQKTTLFPPLARRLGRLTPFLYPVLAALPWLRTHYFGLLIKPASF